jgi:hypothetical protein
MPIVIAGVVSNGVIVPQEPLPEGVRVEIHLNDQPLEVPVELQEELAAWQQASANALELVERMAQESAADEKR